ncbi:tyrosine-type recombinase/integrase [Roseococcus suduntuyensis]|uniref:Integrase n=1 Tax=Roseococcus suduntuyensis TaxID=455361 RepID=A0A840AEN5_9PROT|nr:tyrosine-type recombinase/integrase [Roseococcus suduntuyensis]MBB3900099.1 integrase [Roseococcus suduntuyensis]
MKRELNDAFLNGLEPPASGRLEVWDTKEPGLVWRMTASGAASWGVRARTKDGKRTRPTLGTWPAMSIKVARQRAKAAIVAIAGGADPAAEKKQARAARAAEAAEATVAARWDEWREARAADWSDSYQREVARIGTRDLLPKLGKRPLRTTKREDWTGIIAAKKKSAPVQASIFYRVVSSFLNHAEAEGWIPLPLLPRKGLIRSAPPPKARDRALTDAELVALWTATAAEPVKLRAFVRLLILTGARLNEVAGIATGEIDRAAGLWRLPAARAKNNMPHTMPLCGLALAEIAAAWPEHGDEAGADWRLLGKGGNAFSGFSKLKARLDKATGLAPWRFHDLRRTARTGMARLGVDRLHAERAIAHISGQSKLERTYNLHDFQPETLAALGRWQAHVAGLIDPKPAAEIVPLRRA